MYILRWNYDNINSHTIDPRSAMKKMLLLGEAATTSYFFYTHKKELWVNARHQIFTAIYSKMYMHKIIKITNKPNRMNYSELQFTLQRKSEWAKAIQSKN